MAVIGYQLRINGGALTDHVIDVGNVLTYDITGLTPDTAYDVEVRAYDAGGNFSDWSPVASATTDEAVPVPVIKLDCGRTTGGVVSGWSDETAAGVAVSGGNPYSDTITVNQNGQTNPAPDAVYQTRRYAETPNTFTYTFSGLTPDAPHRLRLHYLLNPASGGSDRHDVTVQGVLVLNDYDINTEAGGNEKVIIEEINCDADSSGEIEVVHTGVAVNAEVRGIEVFELV